MSQPGELRKKHIAYLLYDFHIGGMESFLYRIASALQDEFAFTFIATHVADILPRFHELGTAVYLGQDYRRIMRYLRDHQVDLVQYANLRLYADAALAAGVPVVIERTDGLRGGAGLRSKAGLSAVIASTRGTVEPLSRLIPRERISVIYNGIDVSRFDATPPNRLGFADQDILIGRVSRFAEGKNLGLLIDAIRTLHPRYPQAKLILVGGNSKMPTATDYDSVLREQAAGLEECIHFTGYVERPAAIIRGFDIGTCVSRPNNEGIPNSLLESMACGQPVIGTQVDDIPEIITDGENGFLIEDNSVEQLSTALARLIEDANLRQRMGAAGRARILRDFNLDAQAALYADLYRALLAQPTHPAAHWLRTQRFKVALNGKLIAARIIPEWLILLFKRARGKLRLWWQILRT